MASIRQSKEAEADLIEIWDYIAQNSEEKADQLIEVIAEKLTLLSK